MKKIIIFICFTVILFSCKKSKIEQKIVSKEPAIKVKYSESQLTLNKEYKIGDVRRYGIFPDSSYMYRHPLTNNPKITDVLDIAENESIELFFPNGHYNLPLILDSRENIIIKSDKAEFDIIQITVDPNVNKTPKNIQIKGTIISYDKLGISEATNVEIDSIIIRSDIVKSALKMRSRGCLIYYGSNQVSIKYLQIDDFGSGDERYENNHAALSIYGWGNRPSNVSIDKVYIKSSDRHGVYITGENHFIGDIIIDQFGIGNDKDMLPMQDSDATEEKLFSGVWINRCYNTKINNIYINDKNSKGYFSTNFDEGDFKKPVKIKYLEVKNFNRTLPIRFANDTGTKVDLIVK